MKKLLLFASFALFSASPIISQAQWVELGTGTNAFVTSYNSFNLILADSSQNVYGTGFFTNTAGEYYIAKWNGTSWKELAGMKANSFINSMVLDKKGNLYAGGYFYDSKYDSYVAKWNGTSWSTLGDAGTTGLQANASINALAVDSKGIVYATGEFTDDGFGEHYVAAWDGTAWSQVGDLGTTFNPRGSIKTLFVDKNDNIYIGGHVDNGNGNNVFMWDGNDWNELGLSNGLFADDAVKSIGQAPDGTIYASNGQQDSDKNYYIAKYDGTNWSKILTGTTFAPTMYVDWQGNVFVTGFYKVTNNGTTTNYNIGKWNGKTWDQVGDLNGNYSPLTITTNKIGTVFTAGGFQDANSNTYVAAYKYATTGVSDVVIADNEIKIYPNPTLSVLHIDVEQKLVNNTYGIYNYSANLVKSGTLSDLNNTVNIDDLAAGIYLVQLAGGKSYKITKE